jgi:nitrogen fixation protein FixH
VSSLPAPSKLSSERRAKYFWVTFILGFFVLDLSIAVIAIVMAAGDPSFRPMPEYGDRSVEWEVHQRERLQSQALGWQVDIKGIEPERRAMEIKVIDRDGQPVEGATGSISAYHFTRVSQRQVVEVEEVEAGVYRANVDCRRPGWWKVELRLQPASTDGRYNVKSKEVFVHEASLNLDP